MFTINMFVYSLFIYNVFDYSCMCIYICLHIYNLFTICLYIHSVCLQLVYYSFFVYNVFAYSLFVINSVFITTVCLLKQYVRLECFGLQIVCLVYVCLRLFV